MSNEEKDLDVRNLQRKWFALAEQGEGNLERRYSRMVNEYCSVVSVMSRLHAYGESIEPREGAGEEEDNVLDEAMLEEGGTGNESTARTPETPRKQHHGKRKRRSSWREKDLGQATKVGAPEMRAALDEARRKGVAGERKSISEVMEEKFNKLEREGAFSVDKLMATRLVWEELKAAMAACDTDSISIGSSESSAPGVPVSVSSIAFSI